MNVLVLQYACNSWESTLTHLGIYHEKLFQALDHNKNFKIDSVLKRLFPQKYARHTRSKKAKKSPDSVERKVGQNSSHFNGHKSPPSNGHPAREAEKIIHPQRSIDGKKTQKENTPYREEEDDRPPTSLSGELQGREEDDSPPPVPTRRRARHSTSTSDSSVNEQVLHNL